MRVIVEKIGNTTVLLETFEEDLELLNVSDEGRSTQLTGIEDRISTAYADVKTLIKTIAEDIGTEIKNASSDVRPQQIEMSFNIGISAQAGPVWILSGRGEYALKVKMIWDFQ